MTPAAVLHCAECGTQIAPGLLSCPSCARLVHAARLTELARSAEQSEQAGDISAALAAWREALGYLPPETRQHQTIFSRIGTLSGRVGSAGSNAAPWWKRASALGPVGIGIAILSKAKFLVFGFGQLSTLLTFAVGLSVYWAIWGWQFALGFLLSIYIHEMGHVAALLRYGIPASAPMFIPGLGALVRLRQHPASPIEDARVGLAGPIYGTGAALAALAAFAATGNPFWGAIARAGAWLNLFNLVPVWQLDGSRGIQSLDRGHVFVLAGISAVMWAVTEDGMLLIIAILLAWRAFTKRGEHAETDWTGFAQFAGLLIVLSLLCLIPIPKKG